MKGHGGPVVQHAVAAFAVAQDVLGVLPLLDFGRQALVGDFEFGGALADPLLQILIDLADVSAALNP
jgi:hypothetical protein